MIVLAEFSSIESLASIIDIVQAQLSNYRYTCPVATAVSTYIATDVILTFSQPGVHGATNGVPRRTKLYRNDRILTVIRNLYFAGGASSCARHFNSKFPRYRHLDGVLVRGLPKAMVGLVATVVRTSCQLGHHTDSKF